MLINVSTSFLPNSFASHGMLPGSNTVISFADVTKCTLGLFQEQMEEQMEDFCCSNEYALVVNLNIACEGVGHCEEVLEHDQVAFSPSRVTSLTPTRHPVGKCELGIAYRVVMKFLIPCLAVHSSWQARASFFWNFLPNPFLHLDLRCKQIHLFASIGLCPVHISFCLWRQARCIFPYYYCQAFSNFVQCQSR